MNAATAVISGRIVCSRAMSSIIYISPATGIACLSREVEIYQDPAKKVWSTECLQMFQGVCRSEMELDNRCWRDSVLFFLYKKENIQSNKGKTWFIDLNEAWVALLWHNTMQKQFIRKMMLNLKPTIWISLLY